MKALVKHVDFYLEVIAKSVKLGLISI